VTLAAALPLLVGIGAHADEDAPSPPPPAAKAPVAPAPVAPAAAPTAPTPPTEPTAAPIPADHAVLSGSLIDLGKPIPRARVRVVIPSAELRFPLPSGKHREVWGETDEKGAYSIDVPGIDAETTASIDILHPGHRRLVGTMMRGGDKNKVTLAPGKNSEFNAELPPTLYFAGQVVDEAGKPIEGVRVSSMLDTENSSGGVECTLTDAQGHFAVYGYRAEDFQERPEHLDPTANLSFRHGQYIDAHLKSVEKRPPAERDQLRVVMQAGRSIGGVVRGADGSPAPDLAVSIFQAKPYQRRGTRTDEKGMFRFDGVAPSDARLRIVDVPGNRKALIDLSVDQSDTDMKVSLEPFASPLETTHQVLGMTLADVTEPIDVAYDLQTKVKKNRGAMLVDPGDRVDDFGIGELRPGYVFWLVGNDRVSDVRSMVRQLVKEARSPTVPSASPLPSGGARVRVVYSFNDDQGHGTNTQYMKLSLADIVELERVLRSLGSEERE
jgi:protocatechuate 3,4-dioxygenase beta subunit